MSAFLDFHVGVIRDYLPEITKSVERAVAVLADQHATEDQYASIATDLDNLQQQVGTDANDALREELLSRWKANVVDLWKKRGLSEQEAEGLIEPPITRVLKMAEDIRTGRLKPLEYNFAPGLSQDVTPSLLVKVVAVVSVLVAAVFAAVSATDTRPAVPIAQVPVHQAQAAPALADTVKKKHPQPVAEKPNEIVARNPADDIVARDPANDIILGPARDSVAETATATSPVPGPATAASTPKTAEPTAKAGCVAESYKTYVYVPKSAGFDSNGNPTYRYVWEPVWKTRLKCP